MNFYILNDDEKNFFILNNTWDMNDSRFGSKHSICSVCGYNKLPSNYSYIRNTKTKIVCTNHFGKLDLKMYIVHPLFLSIYQKLCKEYKINRKLSLEDQRDLLPDSFKGIIFRYLPIPHLGIRNSSDLEWNTKITILYNNLVQLIQRVETGKNSVESYREKVERSVKRIFSKEGILGLLSTKQGVFRKLCFGKRIESSGRSVIIGEPYIDVDQVLIPKYLADSLYIECVIDSNEIEYFIEKDIPLTRDQSIIGIKAMRKIKNDDLVLINRQPTLSYGSILAFRAKIREDTNMAIGINPNVTKTFNADFDGDEMNIFCFPQCEDLERMHIVRFPECIEDIQDLVVAKFIFSSNKMLERKDLYHKLTSIGFSISLQDMVDGIYEGTDLQKMIVSGAKGNPKNKEQIIDRIGDQFVSGKKIGTIESNYIKGLNQEEFFIHQMAAREGIVSTGVNTSTTGYMNRKATRSMADVVLTEKTFRGMRIIQDYKGIVSYQKSF
jgi:DNA-directed RNA polymerase beta' subunit